MSNLASPNAAAKKPQLGASAGANALQRKIFTRWVNQKIAASKLKVDDCVSGLSTGLELVALLENLSEKKCPKTLKKLDAKAPPIQKIDNLQHALKFMYDCGVVLELKPSAENFIDGEEKSVLGAIWGIMKTFLKFGDDEDNKSSAVDALKMWCANQVHGYKGVNIQDFTKSWHDGLAFCAIIHKFRPRLIDFDKLNPKEDEKNLKIAMDAAEKFFNLEKFLEPSDFKKLDDKSMVIYVSEYFYGIANQRKVDLAARRIGKLIQFTQTNDKMRAEYLQRAESMKNGLKKVMVHLGDRTIDNTMAGAKKKLDLFTEYREKDKAGIVNDFLSIESLFNQLSLRLSDRKRPLFVPTQGLDLPGLRAALAELEKCEAERKVALVAELNRQIKLANYSDQHATRCGAIASWGKEKAVFVGKVETIESVGAAEYHLNALAAFGNESEALQKGSAQEIRKLGKELLDEKYEHGADVQKREGDVDALFKQLNEQSAAKKQVLDDALAREKYKVLVRGWAQQHVDKHKKLAGWQQDKKEYLESEEKINSIDDAEQALSLLRGYQAESASLLPAAVPALRAVGKKVCDAKYETKFSKWQFEHPQEIHDRESGIDATTQVLAALDAKKLKKLQDDLAREQFKAKLRMTNEQHIDRKKKLEAWVEDAKAYLGTEEKVNSIPTANEALNQLKQWEADKVVQTDTNVNPMKALGQEVLTKKYKTDLSAWQWETPDEIHEREAWVDEQWRVLSDQSKKKLAKLEDDLAREQFKEKLRLLNAQHGSGADKINDWVGESVTYLETKETLLSVAAAEVALNKLEGFESDKVIMTKTTVANLKKLGHDIVTLEYKSALSQWKWETPDQVKDRETKIDGQWKTLSELSVTKKARLDDDLAREKYKALVRTWNGNHVNTHKQISEWVDESVTYLKKAETITNIPTAQAALSALETFESDKVDVTNINVKSLKGYGQQVLTAEYKALTQWKWETPDEINKREAWVEDQWTVLSKLSAEKKAVLQKALELELEKERLRLVYANQAGDYVLWAKETSDDSSQTHFGFTLDEVQKFDLKGADQKVQDASAAKTERWKATYADLTKHEVKDNVYTKLTPSDLEKAAGDLGKALEARGGRYNAELKRQLDNDALCREFAGLAEPLVKEIDSDKDKIAKSTVDLDQQLAYVEERIKAAGGSDRLGKINALQEKMDKAGIKNNPHSAQNARDCEVLWKQYQAFLGAKRTSLGEQIEQKKLRGVTPDQFAEIKQQFTQFDKDASGAIDNRELRACLYSLGYEMGKEAVKSIMTEFGKDDAKHQGQRVMDFNGFKEFMIKQLGDSETKEELLAGFDMVSRSAAAGNNEQADTVLKDEDVQYLRANSPKAGNGQADYKAWILAALAR